MRIHFEYPLATNENMKAIQEAIDAGKDICELYEMFDENMVWDCVAVLSGNKDTPWALLDNMNGHEQTRIEVWQHEVIGDYLGKCEILQSTKTPADAVNTAIQVGDKILLIRDHTEGWEYCLLDKSNHMIDEGGVIDDFDLPLGKAIRELFNVYNLPIDVDWRLLVFDFDSWRESK